MTNILAQETDPVQAAIIELINLLQRDRELCEARRGREEATRQLVEAESAWRHDRPTPVPAR